MKRLLLVSIFGVFALGANAQLSEEKILLDQAKKDKEVVDKSILDEKKKIKPQTWLDRGKMYDQIAMRFVSLDSNAATEAFNSFKKAIELDANKPSKVTKDAQKYLAGGGADEGVNLKQSLIKNGAEKFQLKKYEDAIKIFKLAQEVDSKDTTAQMYASYAALQSSKNSIAAEEMEKYVSSGGRDPGNYAILAQLYRQEKSYDKAISVLDRGMVALPLNKNNFKAERVNVLLEAGRQDAALAGLTELSELEPNNAQYSLNMGILHDNNVSQYQTELRKLNDASSRAISIQKRLAGVEETGKVYADELKRISDLAKKQPKNVDLKRQKTDVENKIKENNTLVAETKVEVEKAKAEAAQLGDVSAKIKDLNAKIAEKRILAKTAYQKAIKADPKNYDALFNMGVFYYNEAVEMKKEVDNMDMKDYQTRGKEVESKVCGKFKQALPYFTQAKAIKEEDTVTESLKSLEALLKQFEEKKITCEEAK